MAISQRIAERCLVYILVLVLYATAFCSFAVIKDAAEDVSALFFTIGEELAVEKPPQKPKQVVVPLDYDEPTVQRRNHPLLL